MKKIFIFCHFYNSSLSNLNEINNEYFTTTNKTTKLNIIFQKTNIKNKKSENQLLPSNQLNFYCKKIEINYNLIATTYIALIDF